jgi:hypothetical protein
MAPYMFGWLVYVRRRHSVSVTNDRSTRGFLSSALLKAFAHARCVWYYRRRQPLFALPFVGQRQMRATYANCRPVRSWFAFVAGARDL